MLTLRPLKLLPVVAVLGLFSLLQGTTALAASDLSVQLAVSPQQATTGQTITVTESVTNSSANKQNVALTNTLQGPTSGSQSQHVSLNPGQTYTQTRVYTVDAATPRGAYTLTLSATDKSGTTTASASYSIS
jgi:uncharacterized repeat protein (TIGR01451 family)